MKRYEGLFILQNPTKEDGIKEIIDAITQEISEVGGRVETVQKMDRKPFARVADKKTTSGYYANVIFEATGAQVNALIQRMNHNDQVIRVLCTEARSAVPQPAAV